MACIRLVWVPTESCEIQSPTPWNKYTNFAHLHTNPTPISHLNYDHCAQKSRPCCDWVRVSSNQGVNKHCTAPSNRNKQSTGKIATRRELMSGPTFISFTSVSVMRHFMKLILDIWIALNMWRVWNGGNWKDWCQSLNDCFVFRKSFQDLPECRCLGGNLGILLCENIFKIRILVLCSDSTEVRNRAQHHPQVLRCHELWEIPS